MARAFAGFGDTIDIVAPYTTQVSAPPGIVVHQFVAPWPAYQNIVGHVRIVLRAWSVIQQLPRPDFIHGVEYLSTGIVAPMSPIPVVLTVPGNIYEREAHGNPFDFFTTQMLKVMAHRSGRHCAVVQCTSSEMSYWWQRSGAQRENLVEIPYGVDADFFQPDPGSRRGLGIADSDAVIVYVGRLSPEKRVDMLIRAVARAQAEIPTMKLHLVGEGPSAFELKLLAGRLGLSTSVVFHGARPLEEVPRWYSCANAVVLPSRSEGLPRVMLEAMACGAPFVATDAPGIGDVIEDGINGFLVDDETEIPLSQRLSILCREPDHRARIGYEARKEVLEKYTWVATVGRLRQAMTSKAMSAFRQ
jgi:glycosyltransferase involved in cell wall biosynthesis